MTSPASSPARLPSHPPVVAAWPLLCLLALAPLAVRAADEPSAVYTVAPSDTLIGLTRTVLISREAWNEVAKLNALKDPNRIWPGQKLNVPLRLLRRSEPPAKVVSAEGDVRVGGQPVKAGDALPAGATLRTAEASSAIVQLGDGSRMKVAPATEATLAEHKRYVLKAGTAAAPDGEGLFATSMRLVRGTVEMLASKVLRAKPLEVETPTAVIGVRGTEYRVHYDPVLAARTEVLEGKVRADTPAAGAASAPADADGADVASGFGAALKPATPPAVVPLLPAPDLSALPARVTRPQLAVKVPEGTHPLRLQIAADEGFDRVVRDARVAPGAAVSMEGLADGPWFLRARQIDALGIEGYDGRRRVELKVMADAPVPVAFATPQKAGSLMLRWQPVAGIQRYRVQVARDAAFTQIVHQDDIYYASAVRVVLAQPGQHHWRVACVQDDGDVGSWSAPEAVEIAAGSGS